MEQNTKNRTGFFKLLTAILCVLLVAAIVLGLVLNNAKNHMSDEVSMLIKTNIGLASDLDTMSETAQRTQDDLMTASQTIDTLSADAAEAQDTITFLETELSTAQETYDAFVAQADASIASLQAELDTLQSAFDAYRVQAEADLAAAIALGDADLEAAQDEAVEAIAILQEDLIALQTEFDAYQVQAEADLATMIAQNAADMAATEAQAAADLQAAQSASDETIAVLQTEFEALQAEFAAYQAAVETTADVPAVSADAEPVEETVESAQDAAAEDIIAGDSDMLFAPDTVLAMVKGQPVTGAEVLESYQHLVNYYGEPDATSQELYYAVALEEAVTIKLSALSAAEMQLDQFTEDELSELYAASDSEWQSALDDYAANNLVEDAATTDAQRAAVYADAEAFYLAMGYTRDVLRQSYVDNAIFTRVQDELCKDVTVTGDEIATYFNEVAQSDEALYAHDLTAYENQMMMAQYGYAEQEPWYRPAGYRYIKHILLPVDEALLQSYNDLTVLSEEEGSTVTAEEIEAVRADILASVQETVDEINAKLAQGASFDDLMAEYGIDPGMTDGGYPDGYEVSEASLGFVPEFVQGAFLVDTVGDISQPLVSQYGVHVILYAGDVPAGPVELTADKQADIRQMLLEQKCNDLLNAWHAEADIEYTGVLRTLDAMQADTAE